MRKYALGRKALGICDRCGQRFYLRQLKKEWNGLKVCSYCYEEKHPSLTPRIFADAQALQQPRPEETSAIEVLVSSTGGTAPWVHVEGTMFGNEN